MVGVVPQIRISGVEITKNHSGLSGRVSKYESIRVLQIGVSNSEKFPGFEPATADPEVTYLTAMLSLHANEDHQSYLNQIVKILEKPKSRGSL